MEIYDVAIVGYGPTGMTLAGLLGQAGHRVVVLERHKGLFNLPRAAVFDDETMRLFQKLGITDAIQKGAVVQRDYQWVNGEGQTLLEIEYPDPADAGWAALYMMYQPDIEAVLDRFDKSLPNVEVRQGAEVTNVAQDSDKVTLRAVDANGGGMEIRARFAVGADGGNGIMRTHVCHELDDYGFQENWLVCDFRLKRKVHNLPMFRQICDPEQPTSIVRIGPNNHRFSFMLEPGVTGQEATNQEDVWSRVSRFLSQDDAELIRVANYVFRSRIADQWRSGRLFLAGDAAHEMPPFLGQGMCSGIRDSHNLAWKFDLVLNGQSDAGLLDTYQPEREPHVRFITEKAIELGRIQTLRDADAARKRDERLLEQRRMAQRGDKLKLPGLAAGLVAGNGDYFPQGLVRHAGKERLLDDLAGAGWRLVTAYAEIDLDDDIRNGFAEIGGRIIQFREQAFEDCEGVYARWFSEHGQAAIVRPDWYVYGSATDEAELARLMRQLLASIRPSSAETGGKHAAG